MSSNGDPSPQLHYSEHNLTGRTTVVLIHGAFVSGFDWDLVIPHLPSTYHLLVPDLPGHGQSQTITPFSLDLSVQLLANLIRTHAITKSAHLIGHSLGASIAIHLAATHPELINSVFISGFSLSPRTGLTPSAIWTSARMENCLPRSWIRWVMDGADIPRIDTNTCTMELCRQIVSRGSSSRPAPWRARTFIVAAGKSGLVPTSDSTDDAVELRDIGRVINPLTAAYTHLGMRHPWNRQAPSIFAETAVA